MAIIDKPLQVFSSQHSKYWSDLNPSVLDFVPSFSSMVPLATGNSRKVTSSDPNWRIKVAKGVNASQAYSFNGGSASPARIYCETRTLNGSDVIHGVNLQCEVGIVPGTFSVDDSTVYDQALEKFKRKLSSHAGNINALTPAIETRDLRHTISQAAKLTNGLLETLLDIKRTRGASAAKYAADAWLTYGFGIAPIISDSKKICTAISDFLLRRDHTATLSGAASSDFIRGGRFDSLFAGAYGANVGAHWTNLYKISYQFKGRWNFNIQSANDYSFIEALSLDLPALVPTAWELVPFSWVADYFGNVGDYLEDLFLAIPGKLEILNVTRKFDVVGRCHLYHLPVTSSTEIVTQKDDTSEWRYFDFTRTPLTSLPHRILRFHTLDEIGRFEVTKLLNLASLLVKK
jgi:hypothetical protein